jgi:hypothetical protein
MTGTLGGFAGEVVRFAGPLRTEMTAATTEASLLSKRRILAAYRAAGFSSLKLKNLGGAPIRVQFKVASKGAAPVAVVYAASGAAYLAERGAPKHDIAPKAYGRQALKNRAGKGDAQAAAALQGLARGGKAQLTRAVMTPQGPRAIVHHKGFKGRHPFRTAAKTLPGPVRGVYAKHVGKAMADTFKGGR